MTESYSNPPEGWDELEKYPDLHITVAIGAVLGLIKELERQREVHPTLNLDAVIRTVFDILNDGPAIGSFQGLKKILGE